jgi:DNA-directed RNA polymerase specialized sigma24 family protein
MTSRREAYQGTPEQDAMVHAAKSGDDAAFNELLKVSIAEAEKYVFLVPRLAAKIGRDDIVQETMLYVTKYFRRSQVTDWRHYRCWLFRAIRSVICNVDDHLSTKKRSPSGRRTYLEYLPVQGDTPHEEAIANELIELLDAFKVELQMLVEGYQPSEIIAALQISQSEYDSKIRQMRHLIADTFEKRE